jgi:hypothetical protein
MARYYKAVGNEALEKNRLEDARDALKKASELDKLRPEIQRSLLEVNKLIVARDDRLDAIRQANNLAREFEKQADLEADALHFAVAIRLLRQADEQYAMVTTEFLAESSIANIGREYVRSRTKAWNARFLQNAQTLSGSGTPDTARQLAAQTPGLHNEVMRALLASELNASLDQLKKELDGTTLQND